MKHSKIKTTVLVGLSLANFYTYADQKVSEKGANMGDTKMERTQDLREMRSGSAEPNQRKARVSPTSLSEGEVKGIDTANKTITLRHGPIKTQTVDMGPMTMSFAVAPAALPLLSKLKVGEKVKFMIEDDPKLGLVVTSLTRN